MQVVFIGTGEATDPELANSSLLIMGSSNVLVDCGYSVPRAFWKQHREPELLDAIYLTHSHADHCFGLPALLLWMRVAGRKRALQLVGGPGVSTWIPALLDAGYPGAFAKGKCYPIEVREVTRKEPLSLGAMQLLCAPSEHSVENHALRVEENGIAIAFSGDGAPTKETEELYAGVRLLVHETYRIHGAAKGHATATDVLEIAERTAVELALLHAAREEKGKLRDWIAQRRPKIPVFVAQEGQTWSP